VGLGEAPGCWRKGAGFIDRRVTIQGIVVVVVVVVVVDVFFVVDVVVAKVVQVEAVVQVVVGTVDDPGKVRLATVCGCPPFISPGGDVEQGFVVAHVLGVVVVHVVNVVDVVVVIARRGGEGEDAIHARGGVRRRVGGKRGGGMVPAGEGRMRGGARGRRTGHV
jgi:hypothetical protein